MTTEDISKYFPINTQLVIGLNEHNPFQASYAVTLRKALLRGFPRNWFTKLIISWGSGNEGTIQIANMSTTMTIVADSLPLSEALSGTPVTFLVKSV